MYLDSMSDVVVVGNRREMKGKASHPVFQFSFDGRMENKGGTKAVDPNVLRRESEVGACRSGMSGATRQLSLYGCI